MQKTMILMLALMSQSVFAANTTYVCNSDDFNADTYTGQSLTVVVNPTGTVVEISKNKGSWYCDSGTIKNPEVLSTNSKADIYAADFSSDECDMMHGGRLIVYSAEKMTYEFRYTSDEKDSELSSDKLTCTEKTSK